MRGFKSPDQTQRFLHVHGVIQNLFRLRRHCFVFNNINTLGWTNPANRGPKVAPVAPYGMHGSQQQTAYRPGFVSRARHTSPMPPLPSSEKIPH